MRFRFPFLYNHDGKPKSLSMWLRLGRWLLIATSLATIGVAAVLPTPSYADPGPQRTYHMCMSRPGSGGTTIQGTIHTSPKAVVQYYVRIRPAAPFGWSGTVITNGYHGHPAVAVPVGSTHWFPSPALIPGRPWPGGRVGFKVEARPNPGVNGFYAIEIWSPNRCT
jgi:hypothetical protein